jgi:imidazolonepropionase-like amidohydrolase
MLLRMAVWVALALPALDARVIVLKAARMFDGKANALISPGVVVVEESRIVELGGSGKPSAGAEVIDLGDATLLPGFMDAHTHLRGDPAADSR